MRMKLAIEELLLLLHKSIKERALHEVQPSLFSILSEGVKKDLQSGSRFSGDYKTSIYLVLHA